MRRYRRKRLRVAASGLVVNAVVFDRRTSRFAIPDSRRTGSLRFEHDLTDRFTHEFRDAAARARSSLAQCVKLFFPQIDLSFFHMCQFMVVSNTCQAQKPLNEATLPVTAGGRALNSMPGRMDTACPVMHRQQASWRGWPRAMRFLACLIFSLCSQTPDCICSRSRANPISCTFNPNPLDKKEAT
jgi:hypothetical protein